MNFIYLEVCGLLLGCCVICMMLFDFCRNVVVFVVVCFMLLMFGFEILSVLVILLMFEYVLYGDFNGM